MATIDKEALLSKTRLPEKQVPIPGVGEVRIRALSRSQVLAFRKRKVGDDVAAMERAMVSAALIDPALTEDEVGQWQEASAAGELEPLTNAIAELSGMDKAATKEAIKQFRE